MTLSAELQLQPDASRYTIARFLDDVAARYAKRIAICGESRSLSYAELRSEARNLAKGLVAAGVEKGSHVAILLGSRPEWAVAYFGAALIGAVVVPINTFAKPRELDHILRHSDASTLIAQFAVAGNHFVEGLIERHPAIAAAFERRIVCETLPHLRRVFVFDPNGDERGEFREAGGARPWQALFESHDVVDDALIDAMAAQIEPTDDAMIVYTSGTTALPKGVVHLQRAPVIQAWRFAEQMGLAEIDVVYSTYPFFWTAGVAMALGGTLAAGARLVIDEVFDPVRALARIEAERATAVQAWPHQEAAMAEQPSARTRDLRSVSKIEFARALAKIVGLEKDEWGTHGSYGMSETFTICASVPASSPAAIREKTSGRPLPGMSIRIVDPNSGELLPTGSQGEICVKGLTLMRGYHKVDPEKTFDDEGYFHSQDGGSFDTDGYLSWTGRLSNLIKTGGANVSPVEIESALLDREDIRAAMAVGIEHPTLGEVVVLCVVPAVGHSPRGDDLRRDLREKMAAFKVPKHVCFFRAEDLEFTGSQKIQSAPLREAVLEQLRRERVAIDGFTYEPLVD